MDAWFATFVKSAAEALVGKLIEYICDPIKAMLAAVFGRDADRRRALEEQTNTAAELRVHIAQIGTSGNVIGQSGGVANTGIMQGNVNGSGS
ncbi:MAG TPA: hypothetical protein VGZ00_04720 [Candidatus Baltobacteraceae bacterium]|jgi:hypothetical protein|nr:hypothetical protein [Candidatus Baltobacteraceae bacterium]